MTTQINVRTEPLSADMQVLLADYPRDAWDTYPGFPAKTRGWLGAHRMFRYLAALAERVTEGFLDGSIAPEEFAADLSYYGDALVRNLHGHHHWEDRSYFPELAKADPRFKAGLDVLEQDHQHLNQLLDDFTQKSNRVIKLIQLDEVQARQEAGDLAPICEKLVSLLNRHLDDEENLAVPIILHHKLRSSS